VADGETNPTSDPAGKKHRVQASANKLILVALATGATIREAAHTAGVCERTVSRRLEKSGFRNRVSELRAALVAGAGGKLASGMGKAADTLKALLDSQADQVRYKASVKLIELGLKVVDMIDLQNRIEELERLYALSNSKPGALSNPEPGARNAERRK
jgi:hypothetical protein